jgi:hypothetical protein
VAATQVAGLKRWVFFPPETDPAHVYAAGATRNRSSVAPESVAKLFDPAVDVETLRAYPLLGNARGRIVCDVGPHETLVVPADWWHAARAVPNAFAPGPVAAEGGDLSAAAGARGTNLSKTRLSTPKSAVNDACVSIAASFVDESNVDAFNDAYGEFEATKSLLKVGAGGIR